MVVDVKKLIGKCCNRIVNIAFGVCIAIIVFLALQLFFVTSFKIPSDSIPFFLIHKIGKTDGNSGNTVTHILLSQRFRFNVQA